MIQFARFCFIIAVVTATPINYIPAKETLMQLLRIKKLSKQQNRMVSISMVMTTYLLSMIIPNISAAITLTGATVNPFIGFIFPIMFYLKIDPKPITSWSKIFAIVIMGIIIFASAVGLVNFFRRLT